jgi:hypothetical protein
MADRQMARLIIVKERKLPACDLIAIEIDRKTVLTE